MEINTTKAPPAFSGDALAAFEDSEASDSSDYNPTSDISQEDRGAILRLSARDAADDILRLRADYLQELVGAFQSRLHLVARALARRDIAGAIEVARPCRPLWRSFSQTFADLGEAIASSSSDGGSR